MRLLVTGGGGFVMAHVVRRWLESDPAVRAVVLDAAPLDAVATAFFAPVADRLEVRRGDVREAAVWDALPDDITHLVHGAAMTPHSWRDEAGNLHRVEWERPLDIVTVNEIGTARALDRARRLPGLQRFVNVSSGSVYANHVPAQGDGSLPLAETEGIDPEGLYAITKLNGEMLTRRFAQLYGLPALSVRLSGVYGPLDRYTSARHVRGLGYQLCNRLAAGLPLRVTSGMIAGDVISAVDVGAAILGLLQAPEAALRHGVYNIAYGTLQTVAELVELARPAVPEARLELVDAGEVDIDQDPALRTGRWGAYDIARIQAATGWRPRPQADALAEYIAWLRREG